MHNRLQKKANNTMKIAYMGKIQLSDIDLSYLNEAERLSDITYIMEVTPRFLNGPAYHINKMYPKCGIFKATDIYPEMARLEGFIDTNKFFIANTPGRLWQLKAFYTNLLLLIFLIKNKFSVIHLTWPLNIYEFILYLLRRKMILTVHDPFPHSELDTFIVRLRRKVAFALVKRFIILNKTQRKRFIDFYHLKCSEVVNSRLSSYTYLKTVKTREGAYNVPSKYILFFGKISQYKGLDYLLPAMCKVHNLHPDVKLIIAGAGKFNFDVNDYQKKDYIEFRNRFIPDQELVALIKNSLFVVCPYTEATQSGVVMSAFAFGKPVLATNVGGLPEMVQNNSFGLIVKEKSADALFQAITTMLSKPEIIATFTNNIKEAYEGGELSWRYEAERLALEYNFMYQHRK